MAKIIQLTGPDNFEKAEKFLKETLELTSDSEKTDNIIRYLLSMIELLQSNEKISKQTVTALQESLSAMTALHKRIANLEESR